MIPDTMEPVLEAAKFCVIIYILVFWFGHWVLQMLAILHSKCKLHIKPPALDAETATGVSILKPLTGVDRNLEENLESFFNINYPMYELLFCVENELDPATKVVEALMQKYPKVDARLLTEAQQVGVNPKINNMIQGYDIAKYEYILISDSGLKTLPDTLLCMVSYMKEDVGLVHQMPYTSAGRHGFAAGLETVVFGTCHARHYLAAEFTGITCLTGMSCLLRKSLFDESGGFAAISQYLPEDYYIAKAFTARGSKIRVSSSPALQNHAHCTVSSYHARMVRWTRLRHSIVPFTILFEPVSECMLSGLLAALSASVLFHWNAVVFFAAHVIAWIAMDYILLRAIQNGPLPMTLMTFLAVWLVRETTCLVIFVQALSSSVIKWRHKKYLIKWGGVGEEINEKSPQLTL